VKVFSVSETVPVIVSF